MGTVFRRKASQRTQFFRFNLKSCAVMLPLIALHPSVTHASDTESNPAVTVIETTQLVGFGEAKYPADFTHFDYVNPDAPKQGKVTYGSIGTYDSFNRFGSRGVAASYTGEIYDTLMFSPSDEIDAYYPLIASKVRYASDFTWMEIDINPKAKFNDGEPITAHDVAFTFNKFSTEGVPQYRVYYKEIKSVTAVSDLVVRIEMEKPNREKLFSFAQSTRVLPEHYWKDKKLSEPLSEPPVGSGPYKIISYKSGQSVTYGLDENYWAADLPVNVGRNNFKEVQYDYYRDDTVMLEAFKAGEFDLRTENSAKFWANYYTGANFDKGYIIKEEINHEKPETTQGFVFNIQSTVFSDPKVREALTYAMDFEWMNKNMFYGQYKRTRSYFQNTDYEAKGLPSEAEVELLSQYKDQIPPRVFTEEFQPPVTDGSGRIRSQMRTAFKLLKEAGWVLKDKVMTNEKTGKPLSFELLIYSPTTERIATPVQKNLKRMGIEMKIRTIDTTQYIKRLRDRDFDMVSSSFSANPYPSPNLMIVWNSNYIDSTYNTAGVMDPVVDALTEEIARNQQDPEKLLTLGRSLDRVLQWNFYNIPQWHVGEYRVAMWDKFERPNVLPKYDLGIDTWWISEEKAALLPEKRR
ncbi:extracellular solute-binding protein [Vibrio sp. 10N.261.46.E12]|uniref:extracellular solute-binding protein n=1 Tax=unclassified Vibrio TaxID=2614977 RepID=UPI00097760EB|nr:MULTISPECIES: extracellular solute-binding protein [unclassified Vibrio]OMO35202.1 antibiotic ABC transporter substrate-binding protein [Vibrio sp. 10N.261.45.E1]PMJ25189.1 antibiotic ABC transporter substrate-binding protein [Vibrio sp. 10N.286.45.B6]PML88376.1 antibiotic ABC transporter substrate-binding protein [Vibrio sp. 10N.261.49.E11]PMM70884.1 antibiotic ABC transporter substrate-binding protein [Vibrio sp. 10N.261.46.F12]PMM80916.1 antibiotic ABC transporter substrate-binding prote